MNLDYIVTSTGRSGTLYVANLLTSLGVRCSHEGVFTNQGIEKAIEILNGFEEIKNSEVSEGDNLSVNFHEEDYVADSSYMSAPFLHIFENSKIIHIVRNPFKVVSSFVKFGYFLNTTPTEQENNPSHIAYEQFIYNNIPELSEKMHQIDRAFLYYIKWNQLIEKNKIDLFCQVEQSENKIKNYLNKDGNHYNNKKCNTRGEVTQVNFSQIKEKFIKNQVKDICEKYGYMLKLFN